MAFQGVKGTTDFFPSDNAVMQYVLGTMAGICTRYNYKLVTAPAVETMKCLTAKSGEEIKSQLFVLEKKGKEELGLRFDLTVPIARMFVSQQRQLAKPVKWFSADNMWRYEAPQKGREREFYQVSAELFGSCAPESDAELVKMFFECYFALGLKEKDFFVKINNRKLLEAVLLDFVPKSKLDSVFRVIDKTAKLSFKEYVAAMKKAGVDSKKAKKILEIIKIKDSPVRAFAKIRKLKLNKKAKEGLEELKQVVSLVKFRNIVVDLSVARGIAYYTGCVFEAFDSKESLRALGAGGRYDNLVKLLGGAECPATGFAIGFSTLKILLEQKKLVPKVDLGPDFFIAVVSRDVLPQAMELCSMLRRKYCVDIDLMQRKLSKQFDYANSIGAKRVIVVGPKELKTKEFTIKDMKTGKESKLKISEI